MTATDIEVRLATDADLTPLRQAEHLLARIERRIDAIARKSEALGIPINILLEQEDPAGEGGDPNPTGTPTAKGGVSGSVRIGGGGGTDGRDA